MLETLVQQLLSEDVEQCMDAVQRIGEMARDGYEIKVAVPRLLKLLQHSDRGIRTSALWVLGYSGEADTIESIKSTLIQEERRSVQDRDLGVINAARTALMRLEEHQQIDSQKRFVANLEKDLQEEREKPKYQAIVNAEIASIAMGGGEASAKKETIKMSDKERNSANQENQTAMSGTVSNTANATASGGSTAIATAGNNNRVSSTITQTHGDTGEWLKTEMGKWLQKADELIESKDDLEDVKKNIERIAGEIDKNGEQADEKRIEQAFLKIWNMSKDVGRVILSGLTGGPLAVVKKVAQLIQQRIDREKQEQVE